MLLIDARLADLQADAITVRTHPHYGLEQQHREEFHTALPVMFVFTITIIVVFILALAVTFSRVRSIIEQLIEPLVNALMLTSFFIGLVFIIIGFRDNFRCNADNVPTATRGIV